MSGATPQARRPCPFCGATERLRAETLMGGCALVRCGRCNATGPVGTGYADAKRLWDRRATPARKEGSGDE